MPIPDPVVLDPPSPDNVRQAFEKLNQLISEAAVLASAIGVNAGNIATNAGSIASVSGSLSAHAGNTSNPHSVTKAQVGLGNVTNDAQLKAASNLADLAGPASARVNIGLSTISQAEAEAGTATTERALTAQRIAQAISSLAPKVPTGTVFQFAGSSAPAGYLLCYGQAVSRTTYAALFAVVGTTYGVGDGSTTFNVVDMRGRGAIGLDNMGGTSANRVTNAQADTLGGNAGAETHTLTTTEMPAHSHDIGNYITDVPLTGGGQRFHDSYTGVSSNSAGGGAAHNNMQPYIAQSYIIKT